MMPGVTLATWNTNFRTPDRVVEAQVGVVVGKCQAAVFTEARSPGVTAALAAAGWRGVMAEGSSEMVAWDPAIWRRRRVGPEGVQVAHGDGPGRYMPGREVSWVTLTHRATDTDHLVIASHVTAGYAGNPDQAFERWRERAARRHLLAIVEVSARLMALEGRQATDYHHLAGDLNAGPDKRAAWWWPARLLDSLYVPDKRAGLDWLAHSRQSSTNGLQVRRRWTEPLGSEGFHPVHYKRVTFPRRRT